MRHRQVRQMAEVRSDCSVVNAAGCYIFKIEITHSESSRARSRDLIR